MNTNVAHSPDSQAFDDLLGQLVGELAMTPEQSAPQMFEAAVLEAPSEPRAVAPPVAQPTRRDHTIPIVGMISGAVVALGIAAMMIFRPAATTPVEALEMSEADQLALTGSSAPTLSSHWSASPIIPLVEPPKPAPPAVVAEEEKPKKPKRRRHRKAPKDYGADFDEL